MPAVAFITVWWLLGFNVLLFIAGLRNISSEIYEAAGARRRGRAGPSSRRITWPLIWPVTVLVFTIQLILQLKIFDQVYLFAVGGRTDATMVMVQYIYREAFQQNNGGLAAAAALVLFLLIVVLSVLQFQLLRARGRTMTARRRKPATSSSPPLATRRLGRLRRLDLVGLLITVATLVVAVAVGVSALLGAGDDVQARIRGGAGPASTSGRSTSRSKTTSTS